MIAFLIDADNLSASEWIEEAFHTLEKSEGPIAIRRAYGSAENLKGLTDVLRTWAIRPFVNLCLSKNTTDMSLAIDAMELACLAPRPKLVVIGSGDLDSVPLVVRLRERGIKVVCISEQSKMAAGAVSAYDQVLYVGAEVNQNPPTKKISSTVQKKAVAKTPAIKKVKAVVPKNAVKKSTSTAVTLEQILIAAPDLKTENWIALSAVGKLLHDEKLVSKNASSTKLFNMYPDSFELNPKKQPSKVRFIKT